MFFSESKVINGERIGKTGYTGFIENKKVRMSSDCKFISMVWQCYISIIILK